MKRALFHGKRKLDAKLIETKHGLCWSLSDEEYKKYKRKFIPFSGGRYSMIQKALRLEEKVISD